MRDRRESEPPVLATEWVNNVDGVIYGEILSVEPVDLFYRYGTGALDMEGLCQDPTWQLSHAVDLKVAPEFAVGLPAHDDVVRIRLGVGILVEWDGAHRYRDGRLVSADGREGLEPGMMVGARIWDLGLHEWAVGQEGPVPDLGLDDGERVYTPLKSSLFYFDDDDRLRFQFSTELSSDWECARPNERFFQREVDDIREGLPRREFEALLSELSPEAFGRYTSTRVEIGRVLPFPWMFEALDPEIRAESGRAFIDYLASYTASACQDPEWQRFPPRDPDAWDEEEDPSEE